MYTVFLSVQGLCKNAKESYIKVIKTYVVSTISTLFVIRVTKKVQSFTVLPSFLNNLFEDLLCRRLDMNCCRLRVIRLTEQTVLLTSFFIQKASSLRKFTKLTKLFCHECFIKLII